MQKFRLAILGVGATLALSTAGVFAMASGVEGGGDAHGDQISAAAQSDTGDAGTTDKDAHGDAVSAVAKSDTTATCQHGPSTSPVSVTNHGCAVSTVAKKGTH